LAHGMIHDLREVERTEGTHQLVLLDRAPLGPHPSARASSSRWSLRLAAEMPAVSGMSAALAHGMDLAAGFAPIDQARRGQIPWVLA
jgi:hypothetical protein